MTKKETGRGARPAKGDTSSAGRRTTPVTPATAASPYTTVFSRIAKMKPETWRVVAEFSSDTGAKDLLNRLRSKGWSAVPAGKWELWAQKADAGGVETGSQLIARYMGPANTAQVSWYRYTGQLVSEVPASESQARKDAVAKRWADVDLATKKKARKVARG